MSIWTDNRRGASVKKSYMKALLAPTRDFGSPVPIVPFAGWDYYYTNAQLDWAAEPGVKIDYNSVSIPRGFVTDLASTPRIFWSIFPPAAAYSYPAIIHDYLYWFQPCERKAADDVFRAAMSELKVSPAQIYTVYSAVRAGGSSAWTQNAQARRAGERRVLREFPQIVSTTWAEWKANPAVFAEV